MKGQNGKRAVNRHTTQSRASAGAQERAIERQERQRAKKDIAAQTKHEFPIVPFDGKLADFCVACGEFKRAQDYDPVCRGSREKRLAARDEHLKCVACNGSGHYDHNGSPPCGACGGTGRARVEARSVTVTDAWGHKKVVGGFGDVGGAKRAPPPKAEAKGRTQCAKCPWRVDVDPHDIPNGYCEVKHGNLKGTIAEPGSLRDLGSGRIRVMACHEFPSGRESPCVGWVMNQLGPGNNIALRMKALDGQFKNWRTVGEQHETFEDTLPKSEDE